MLTKMLHVTAGATAGDFVFTSDPAASPIGVQSFQAESLTFTASAGVTTLTFTGTNAGCAGPIIDDVAVVPAM